MGVPVYSPSEAGDDGVSVGPDAFRIPERMGALPRLAPGGDLTGREGTS